MKKIRNNRHLLAEKKLLWQRKAQLEKAIRYDWRELKDSLRPGRMMGSLFNGFTSYKKDGKDNKACFATSIPGVASGFVRKAFIRAEEKMEAWLKNKKP